MTALAMSRGFQAVESHLDTEVMARSIIGQALGSLSGWSIVKQIRNLSSQNSEERVNYVYREANQCTDTLLT